MRLCWGNYTLLAVTAALALVSLLSGCGSKGPLYSPSEQKQEGQR